MSDTHQVAVEDVVDELEKELVEKEEGARADFGAEDEEGNLGEKLHGCVVSFNPLDALMRELAS